MVTIGSLSFDGGAAWHFILPHFLFLNVRHMKRGGPWGGAHILSAHFFGKKYSQYNQKRVSHVRFFTCYRDYTNGVSIPLCRSGKCF